MIIEYLEELYDLYISYPYLTYDGLAEHMKEKYKVDMTSRKIRELLIEKYPNITEEKKKNKAKGGYFTNEQLNILYKLYTEPPFMNYEKLTKYAKEKFMININCSLMRTCLINEFKFISKIKTENRAKFKGKWNKKFTKIQLEKMYRLYIEPPYYRFDKIAEYVEEKYNIKVSYSNVREELLAKYPDIISKRNEKKNDVYMNSDGRALSSSDKKVILDLVIEGYTQREIASLTDVSQSYISKIIKKSKVEIEELKFKRILFKLGDIHLNSVRDMWEEIMTISGLCDKLKKLGCEITQEEVKYLLKNKLNCKKKCKLCGREMSIDHKKGYCSNKCKKEARRDSIRRQQINRRVRGDGKTTQSVSRVKKIKEANGVCYLCGEKLNTRIKDKYHPLYIVLDHVDPLIYSNNSDEDNLRAVCRCCNNLKSDKPANYYSREEYIKNKIEKIETYKSKGDRSSINREEFKKDCVNGMTTKCLCEKYNRSNFTIYKIKKELGLLKEQKKHAKLNSEHIINIIVNLTKQGYTILYIAHRLNVSVATVSNYRKLAVQRGILESGKRYYVKEENKA